ncbi:phage tail protein [Nostoc sp. 3335mG]|nr:phage tail protein [Nostoc sp. 3335mG]
MTQPFIGEIRLFPYGFPPAGWAYCAGQLLSTQQNQPLFVLLGSQYGGNGVTTFALPDLRGRALIGTGTGGGATYAQGQLGGVETVTLVSDQIPSHSHLWQVTRDVGDTSAPASNYFAGSRSSDQPAAAAYATNPTTMVPMASTTIGLGGGSQPHNNMQPYIALAYCIALRGVYPTRD